MEKTNWIEKIREFIRKAMNKGLRIRAYNTLTKNDSSGYYVIGVFKEGYMVEFTIEPTNLCLDTSKGAANFDLTLSKRDLLELDAMVLSIEEYNEDMALTEFNNFFGEEENKVVNINDLDNDEE